MNLKKCSMISAVLLMVVFGLAGCGEKYSLQVTKNFANGGTVMVDPTGPYKEGQVVTLTVAANTADGWTFAGWGGDAAGTDAQISITMDGNHTVEVKFDHNWTVNGTVEWLASSGSPAQGAQVALGGQTGTTDGDGAFSLTGTLLGSGGANAELVINHALSEETRTAVDLLDPGAPNAEIPRIHHVDPVNGNDSEPNDGSAAKPFKTIGKAATFSGFRRVILTTGVYTPAGSIQSDGDCEIVGNADNPSSYVINSPDHTTIIHANGSGTVKVTGVKFTMPGPSGSACCVIVTAGRLEVSHSIFAPTSNYGADVMGGAEAVFANCQFTGAATAADVRGDGDLTIRSRLVIRDSEITNCGTGIGSGYSGYSNFDIVVSNTTMTGSPTASSGISFQGNNPGAMPGLEVENVTISSFQYGMWLDVGTPEIRNSSITGCTYGIRTGGSSSLDLGTSEDPGGNIIKDNTSYGLFDVRIDSSGVIWAVGNTWNGMPMGTKTSADSDANKDFCISNAGNSIVFSE